MTSETFIVPTYFAVLMSKARISHDRHKLEEYIATLKHALLFNSKITLADYMVVNSPNFRIAYHLYGDFREIIDSHFIDVAHFQIKPEGGHYTLPEHWSFYKKWDLYHPDMPTMFHSTELEKELIEIERKVIHVPSSSENRDRIFSSCTDSMLELPEAKAVLKNIYSEMFSTFQAAYDKMRERTPVQLGVIHFDKDYLTEPTIYDYMAERPSARASGMSADSFRKKYGYETTMLYRTLLVGVESSILGVSASLPAESAKYHSIMMDPVSRDCRSIIDKEMREVEIDLKGLNCQSLSRLSGDQIIRLRKEGQRYFSILDRTRGATGHEIDMRELIGALEEYTRYLNREIPELVGQIGSSRVPKGLLRMTRGLVSDRDSIKKGITGIVELIGIVPVTHIFFTPLLKKGITNTLHQISDKLLEQKKTVDASIVTASGTSRLTQYE